MKKYPLIATAVSLTLAITACTSPIPVETGENSSSVAVTSSNSISSISEEAVSSLPESNADCEQFTQQYEMPSTTVPYSNSIVSFSIPFNHAWDVEPFINAEGTILFGTPRMGYSAFDGCGERRDFWYNTREKRTATEAKEYYETEFPVDPKDVVIDSIGSLEVVRMTNVQGVCPSPFVEIIGKNENHIFSTSCEAIQALNNPLEELERINQSLKLK